MVEIAQYVSAATDPSDEAFKIARYCLMDSLGWRVRCYTVLLFSFPLSSRASWHLRRRVESPGTFGGVRREPPTKKATALPTWPTRLSTFSKTFDLIQMSFVAAEARFVREPKQTNRVKS